MRQFPELAIVALLAAVVTIPCVLGGVATRRAEHLHSLIAALVMAAVLGHWIWRTFGF